MASNLFYVHVIRTWMTNVGHFFKVVDDTGSFYRYCDRVDVSSSSGIVGFIRILSYSIFVYQFVLLCNYGGGAS